ncbi:hypothetical protein D1159_05580 [Pseudoflavonifractor sp. 524-17]|uniref:hypothetical protein n=1 Tax=Pseudoflavonifractor sp. 524-17 TaxID=2304577 RepID=UPI0013797339|nr:hypothetical protein [Pseudoflavonifractor sp. 524-17]NCE64070.1 hypothetical protein [Pseudoflavonifractor sp. 524-17]
MLEITIPETELFDGVENFIYAKGQTLRLEHSLVSLSKWESKWHKPFLSKKKTREESIDYVRCMTLTQNVDPSVYKAITPAILREVNAYIDAPMTATTVRNTKKGGANREVVTAEIIYYWMIFHNIPFECQKWHLNRLLTLINVCNAKGQKPQKIPRSEQFAQNRILNAANKKKWNTRG